MKRAKHTASAAKLYLSTLGAGGAGIAPQPFAASANELGVSFDSLMRYIARMYAGGAQSNLFREQDIAAAAAAGGSQ